MNLANEPFRYSATLWGKIAAAGLLVSAAGATPQAASQSVRSLWDQRGGGQYYQLHIIDRETQREVPA